MKRRDEYSLSKTTVPTLDIVHDNFGASTTTWPVTSVKRPTYRIAEAYKDRVFEYFRTSRPLNDTHDTSAGATKIDRPFVSCVPILHAGKSFDDFLTWYPGPKSPFSCSTCKNNNTRITKCDHRACLTCIGESARKSSCAINCPACGTTLFTFKPGENVLRFSAMAATYPIERLTDPFGLNAMCMIAILMARFPNLCSPVVARLMFAGLFGNSAMQMIERPPSPSDIEGTPTNFEKFKTLAFYAYERRRLVKCIFNDNRHDLFPYRDFRGEGRMIIATYLNGTSLLGSLEEIICFFATTCEVYDVEQDLLREIWTLAREKHAGRDRPVANRLVKIACIVLMFDTHSNKFMTTIRALCEILALTVAIFKVVFWRLFGGSVAISASLVFWLALMLYGPGIFTKSYAAAMLLIVTI